MSEIDVQNAKQIRDPMTVLITMEVPDDEVTLTYSGYSTAKVADGSLGNAWPMRLLADLKGDGFPLNGNHVVYNPSTSASETNGKIGVRSNIGQAVSVTVTGNKSIASLSIFVTGATSVTYNGTTTAIVGGQAVIPVGARSITLTFNPVSAKDRIEVSEIVAGTTLRITNETLIKATVSLRSDLSLFDQTLPESELNVEVYNDADISEIVAGLPEDTPITYQAGYEGDMSPIRKFYVSGQVTWADNVLNIHAVDAVHFLDDISIPTPVTESKAKGFVGIQRQLLNMANIDYVDDYFLLNKDSDMGRWIVKNGVSARNFIAFCSQTLNFTDSNGYLLDDPSHLMWYTYQSAYIDAGIPTLRSNTPSPKRTIYESDCADIKKNIAQPTTNIEYTWDRITNPTISESVFSYGEVGKATFEYGVGTTLDFNEYTYGWGIGLFLGYNIDNDNATKLSAATGYDYTTFFEEIIPVDDDGGGDVSYARLPTWGRDYNDDYAGVKLAYGQIPQEHFTGTPYGDKIFSSFVPWSQRYNSWPEGTAGTIQTMAQMFAFLRRARIIGGEVSSVDLDIYGNCFETVPVIESISIGDSAKTYEYQELQIIGEIYVYDDDKVPIKIFPDKMLAAPMYRSPLTYSFTWKGDPRMQPRDVVEWERLDGTPETITLENITITHEKGGTVAEITARKGIV